MYKTALARQKRNKRIYKKLVKSLKNLNITQFKFAPVSLVLIIGMLFINIPITNAYFSDTESLDGNIFSAGTLSVDISGAGISGIVLPGSATTTIITLSKSNPVNLDYQYFASSTIEGGVAACDYITISASSSPQNYSVLLKNFISAVSAPAGPAQWDFTFAVGSGAPVGTCNFKIIYTAWQTDSPNSSQGFSDVAEVVNSIQIGQTAPIEPAVPNIVLNEILPNPDSSFSYPANKEFIELYNNGDTQVNIGGWKVSEITGGGTENKYTITISGGSHTASPTSGSTIIQAKGFIVLLLSDSTALNNSGDTIRLYDNNGNELDKHIYSTAVDCTFLTPTPNNPNVDDCSSVVHMVQPGKSYARIPDGTGSWVDPIPTPGEPNKMEEISGGGGGGGILPDIAPTDVLPIATTTEEVASTTPEIIMEEIIIVEPEVVLQSDEEVEIKSEPVTEPEQVPTEPPEQEIPITE
jgi:hypothetical protein